MDKPIVIKHTAKTINDLSKISSYKRIECAEEKFKQLLEEPSDEIELDFVIDECGTPIWSHSPFKPDNLSIYDIININNHKKRLLIEFKYFTSRSLDELQLNGLLTYLSKQDDIDIQSFNYNLVRYIVDNKDKFPNIEIGLIINFFNRKYANQDLSDLDFASVTYELCNYKGYYDMIKGVKKYLWLWDTLYPENEKRIQDFINKKPDGVIVNDVNYAKRLINR